MSNSIKVDVKSVYEVYVVVVHLIADVFVGRTEYDACTFMTYEECVAFIKSLGKNDRSLMSQWTRYITIEKRFVCDEWGKGDENAD